MNADLFKPAIHQAGIAHGPDLALSPENEAFETFWEIKPSREGSNPKSDAKTAFLKLLARKVNPETIIEGARRWADEERSSKNDGTRFVKTAVAWLNLFGRENAYQASEPPTKKDRVNAELDARMVERGWRWGGEKWVRVTDQPTRQLTARPGFTVRDRATLFVSRETPWYVPYASRHEASDKTRSYYGNAADGRPGIWVPPDWHEAGRPGERLQFHQLRTPATEILQPQKSQPFASAMPFDGRDGPPMEAYADALSVPDEEIDFSR